ncbi:MAG TPA: hypothetical protein VF775_04065, partial [Geobacteraceae bacterium]
LVYSGNISNVGDPQSTTSNSIFVTNTAQLYKGVALGVSGGYSTSTQPGGGQSQSVILSSGLSLIPRKDLNVNLGYSETSTQQSGGVVPSSSTYTRSGALSVSYTPFETLYLTGAWAISASNDQPTTTTQNYGASWSPFRGGTLQFNFNYSESLSSPDNQKTRSLSPSARWNVRPGTTVDFTYQYFTISGPSSGETVGNTLAATLRIAI